MLSAREAQVLTLAARGLPVAAIADQLHVSRSTVKRAFEAAYARLGVSDRAAAVAVAMRTGLIA